MAKAKRTPVKKSTTKTTTKKATTKKSEPKAESKHEFGEPVFSEYNGNPIMKIPLVADGRFGLSFGLSKAKKIVEYIEEIKQFIADNS